MTYLSVLRHMVWIRAADAVIFRVDGERAILGRTADLLDLVGSVSVPAAERGFRGIGSALYQRSTSCRPAVTAFLDANILMRHLTGDPPELAARATRSLVEADDLRWPDLIVAETIYVLESFFEVERPKVAGMIQAALAFPAIQVVDEELLLRALEVYEVDRIDFAEAYLVASAERSDVRAVVSFDRSIDRVTTVKRIEPHQVRRRR